MKCVVGYRDAIIAALSPQEREELLGKQEAILACFAQEELTKIFAQPFVPVEQKLGLLLEVLEIQNPKIIQIFRLVAEAKRLSYLPQILNEVERYLCLSRKQCSGILFSQEEIQASLMDALIAALEKKTGYEVKLSQHRWDKEGVKCCIDDLNLEISFCKEKFVEDLSHLILSSINERSIN